MTELMNALELLRNDKDERVQSLLAAFSRARKLRLQLKELIPQKDNALDQVVKFIEAGRDQNKLTGLGREFAELTVFEQCRAAVAPVIAQKLHTTLSELKQELESLLTAAQSESATMGFSSAWDFGLTLSFRVLTISHALVNEQHYADEVLLEFRERRANIGTEAVRAAFDLLNEQVQKTPDFLMSPDLAPRWCSTTLPVLEDRSRLVSEEMLRTLNEVSLALSLIEDSSSRFRVGHIRNTLCAQSVDGNLPELDHARMMLEWGALNTYHGLERLYAARTKLKEYIDSLCASVQQRLGEVTLPADMVNLLADYSELVQMQQMLAKSEKPFLPLGIGYTCALILSAFAKTLPKDGCLNRFPRAWEHREQHQKKKRDSSNR